VVAIAFDQLPVAEALAADSGTFLAGVMLPATALPGTHELDALGKRSGRLATTSITIRTNWAQSGFDSAHDGNNRFENQIDPTNVATLTSAWTAPLGVSAVRASPIVVNGALYIGDDQGTLHALDAATGQEHWGQTTESFYAGSAAYSRGHVIASPLYGQLHGHDATTGAVTWTLSCAESSRAPPLVVRGTVYDTCTDGTVYAIDAATGSVKWSVPVGCCVQDQSPAASDGVLFQLSTGHTLTALDAVDGRVLWSVPAFAVGSVAIDRGLLFYNDYPNVVAVNTRTGATEWQAPVLTYQPDGAPAVAGGRVFVATGRLSALDEGTGDVAWTASAASPSGPVVANGVVFASDLTANFSARWDAFDASSGEKLAVWRTPAGTCFAGTCTETTPVVANGTLYLAGPGPQITAFRLP
jgi:outer membrane protein assembly factor BamB